ncbi:hypothetical protein [uncultured Tateyamaria sp.]|nr:hypothetical protein [uncultured Tateyamaria sp.]
MRVCQLELKTVILGLAILLGCVASGDAGPSAGKAVAPPALDRPF